MTTAHRPTFDPARGKDAQRGVAYHQRLLPAHKLLKVRLVYDGEVELWIRETDGFRQPGQGGDADKYPRDLRTELLAAEAANRTKKNGGHAEESSESDLSSKRPMQLELGSVSDDEEEMARKRRRVLEETRDIDADSDGGTSDSSHDEGSEEEEEDETAELMRELEKIKKERAAEREREEAAKLAKDQEEREEGIALGNPLLNAKSFNVKRRWDDDVVFKNQARGTEQKGKKEFVNDLLRSDFHKRFMSKYIR